MIQVGIYPCDKEAKGSKNKKIKILFYLKHAVTSNVMKS
jgi:hypothetical protein